MRHPAQHAATRPAGEPWVWLSSMGLAIGLFMVAGLLGLILVNGLGVFWPKPVLRLELRDGAPSRVGNSAVIGGVLSSIRERFVPGATGGDNREWHLMIANKDVYGAGFRYIALAEALRVERPADAIVIERIEYGPSIGLPVALERKDGSRVPYGQPTFDTELEKTIREVKTLRDDIRKVERDDIGRVNHAMENLRLREKALPESGADAERAAIAQEQAALQSRYDTLAGAATALRAKLDEATLVIQLFTGEEHRIPSGKLVHVHYPNRMTFGGKLAHFARGFWHFIVEEPREANTEGGIFPAIFGTFVMTILMSLAVTPFGVLAAIYLREYAKQGPFVRMVRISVNNLAGVPSIVFGVFGLGFFVYFVGGSIDHLLFQQTLPTPTFGTGGILWAAFTLALMTVPVVIVATEEALAAVPRGAREGSLALGASKWQTIARVVLPASAPGILTGLVLAMARGAGEVAPLMLVGVVKLAPSLPIDALAPFVHLDRKFMHLGFHIYDLGFQSPDSDAAKPMVFATTLFLILLVVVLNMGAIIVRERLRRKYATGAF